MYLSLYSFLMALLWSSSLIFLFCCFRRNRTFVMVFGIWPLLALSVCTLLRCFLPIEILPFTQEVVNRGLFAKFNTWLFTPLQNTSITPLLLGELIWIIVTLVLLGRFLWNYLSFRRFLKKLDPEEEDSPLYASAQAVCRRMGLPQPVIYITNLVRTPTVTGFLIPIVLVPFYPYEAKDYDNLFSHELTHWKNHDIWIKLLVKVICCLFWWNPLVYLLKKDVDQTLELKCDFSLIRNMTIEDRIGYVETIKTTLAFAQKSKGNDFSSLTVAEFVSRKKKDILQRANVILNYEHHPKRIAVTNCIMTLLMAALMVFSYSFVIQPSYEAPASDFEEGGYKKIPSGGLYLVQHEDGTYTQVTTLDDGSTIISTISEESAQLYISWGYEVRTESEVP